MENDILLRTVVKFLTPFIFMFGLYVQFHGDYSPGGGFQAGVICAAAFIAHALINGLSGLDKVVSEKTARTIACLGVLLYGGTGVYAMHNCGNFLDYSVLTHSRCDEVASSRKIVTNKGADNINKTSEEEKKALEDYKNKLLDSYSANKENSKIVEIKDIDAVHGQHIGILLIEAGVGLTVFSVMILVFYMFANRVG